MAKRGSALREHVLSVAKDVFLEMGFERTSMDLVSNRAGTSKRSLYAHFESKEKLFLAVVEMVRSLLLKRLRAPQDHPGDVAEALTAFCGRYVEILLFESSIRMCRISMAEVSRFPEGAAQFYDIMFMETESRLSLYLQTVFELSPVASNAAASRLLGRILYPRLTRALFGMDSLQSELDPDSVLPNFDFAPIRAAVAETIAFIEISCGKPENVARSGSAQVNVKRRVARNR